jgi:hypothetical protein
MDTNGDDGSLIKRQFPRGAGPDLPRRICFACGPIRPVCGPGADLHDTARLALNAYPRNPMPSGRELARFFACEFPRKNFLGFTVTDEAAGLGEVLVSG